MTTVSEPKTSPNKMAEEIIVVREFNKERDCIEVSLLERRCEIGPSAGKPSLLADLMGDPMARIRHSPSYLMLIAECKQHKQMVGVVRGCIKTVTRGTIQNAQSKQNDESDVVPLYTKVAYILGLRVIPSHRRKGVGSRLVHRMEEWFKENRADYAYMATEKSNVASLSLFTNKFHYTRFQTPTILVYPVHAHTKPVNSQVDLIKAPTDFSVSLYRHAFRTAEFFPKDIDSVLANRLTLGTFVAVRRTFLKWVPGTKLPDSYAMASVWNCGEVFKLQVKGVPRMVREFFRLTRVADRLLPSFRIPSVPNIFRPFGIYVVYGLHVEGKDGAKLMRELWWHVYNLATRGGAQALVAEVAPWDPVAKGVPHWGCFSCAEDVWCIKNLNDANRLEPAVHLVHASSSITKPALFVDPRDF